MRSLFIPTAVIGGFLILGLGPAPMLAFDGMTVDGGAAPPFPALAESPTRY